MAQIREYKHINIYEFSDYLYVNFPEWSSDFERNFINRFNQEECIVFKIDASKNAINQFNRIISEILIKQFKLNGTIFFDDMDKA